MQKIYFLSFFYFSYDSFYQCLFLTTWFLITGRKAFREYAELYAKKSCCKEACLSRYFAGNLDKTIAFVESCLLETDDMNQREKSAYMFAKVQGTIKGFRSVTRTAEHAWAVGDAIKGKVVRDVCRYSKYAFPLPVYAFLSHGLCRTCF